MQYERIEPFGDRRADILAGIIAATIANVNRTKKEPFKVADFIPKWEARPVAPQSPEKHLQMMLLAQKLQNAKIENSG